MNNEIKTNGEERSISLICKDDKTFIKANEAIYKIICPANYVTIIKYKSFKTDEDFTKWQLEADRKIIHISPITAGATSETMTIVNDTTATVMKSSYQIFVTYSEKVEKVEK